MNFEQVMLIINSIFFVLGGVAVFMIGMEMMGNNLEKSAGRSIRKLMNKATKNKAAGIGTGLVITALVNSSSATTVMIVGFVNVGLMTLNQAVSIIMGANIGTTISAFIMALSSTGGAIDIAAIFALVAFVGLLMTMISKKDNVKRIGNILSGVGLIFVGLEFMSMSVGNLISDGSPVRTQIESIFLALGSGGGRLTWQIPVLFLIGLALTAVMQSSAAITGIAITLASNGLITLPMAMCIVLGTNIGTCCTSLLSAIGANINAVRAAVVHLLFNVLGSLIFIWPVAFVGEQIASLLSFIPSVQWQIAVFHMLFNVLTTFILVWFSKYIVKLACLIVPDSKNKPVVQEDAQETLDVRLLKTPAIAVGQVRNEIVRMGDKAFANYKRSLDMLLSYDVKEKPVFDEMEQEIDRLNKYITQFLIKVSSEPISETDEKKISSFYHVTSDIERIGDYAENITEFAVKMVELNATFSEQAVQEIRDMDLHISELYKNVKQAFATHNLENIAIIEKEEEATDKICTLMHQSHISRTNEGLCTPEAGSVYLQLAVNMERIGDHMFNVANSIKSYTPTIEK